LRTSARVLAGIAALALLAALGIPVWYFRESPLRNLLLVSPIADNTPAFDLAVLDRLGRDGILLTYEIRRAVTVRTAYASLPVTLAAVNHAYPALTGFRVPDAGFFTHAAERAGNREAVLNRAAARLLYGSGSPAGTVLGITDVPYLVVGVLEDGEGDAPRVYIPARADAEGPAALLVLLDPAAGLDAGAVKDALRARGIAETSYHFYDFSRALRVYGERLGFALRVFACGLIAAALRALRRRLALIGGAAVCLGLLRQCLLIFLGWAELPPAAVPAGGDFPALTGAFVGWYYAGMGVFVLCLIACVFMAFFESSGPFH
jgi:hypothetical protein